MAIPKGLTIYSSILALAGGILYFVEFAYLIYLAIDAKDPVNNKTGPAVTKCPDYFNDKGMDCVSLWKIATGLSFLMWFDGLLVIIVFICITFTCYPFAKRNLKNWEILVLAITSTSLKLDIFLFAWIQILLSINLSKETFITLVTGALFIPWILALDGLLKDWINHLSPEEENAASGVEQEEGADQDQDKPTMDGRPEAASDPGGLAQSEGSTALAEEGIDQDKDESTIDGGLAKSKESTAPSVLETAESSDSCAVSEQLLDKVCLPSPSFPLYNEVSTTVVTPPTLELYGQDSVEEGCRFIDVFKEKHTTMNEPKTAIRYLKRDVKPAGGIATAPVHETAESGDLYAVSEKKRKAAKYDAEVAELYSEVDKSKQNEKGHLEEKPTTMSVSDATKFYSKGTSIAQVHETAESGDLYAVSKKKGKAAKSDAEVGPLYSVVDTSNKNEKREPHYYALENYASRSIKEFSRPTYDDVDVYGISTDSI